MRGSSANMTGDKSVARRLCALPLAKAWPRDASILWGARLGVVELGASRSL